MSNSLGNSYRFTPSQLPILNQLIFDASIARENITSLKINNNNLEIPLERRTFENVIRKKILFWTITKIKGKTSLLSFRSVTDFKIEKLKEEFQHNQFVEELILKNNNIKLYSINSLIFQIKTSNETIIELTDLNDSDFGNGTIFGKAGFTANEWKQYLQNNHFQF